jgi:hypothetical protein
VDDNCNSLIDEGVKTTYYRDSEGDDYGVSSDTIQACSRPAGYAALSGDCDDGVSNTNPGAIEVCNGVDDDCDGNVDEGVKTTYYRDSDGDNYGVTSDTTLACTVPTGYAELSGDCNDGDAAINPGATEACDGVDSDCDGVLDGSEGITQPCGTTDVGLCRYGDESCTNAGGWTGCDSVEPTTEVCDGYDRNCDGYKNKNNAGITLTSSTSCGTDACVGTKTKTCSTSGAWRAYGDCSTKNNYAGIKCGKCDASGTPVYDETRDSDCGTKNCDGLDNCYAYGNGCEIRDYDAIQKRCTGLGKCEDPTCSRYLASNQKVDYCDGDWSAYWSCGDDGNLHKYQTCYSVGCSNGACTSTPHANTNNDHFTSCGGRSCVAPKTFNMDAACVPAPPACGATGTACSTNADCCNQRENKCNLLGKCVQRAGCPYIYACSEEDCSYVHDAFAMSFMKSLEEYSYQTYKGNLDYIKITEPFEEETSYINDFRVYGIDSDASFFLPEENTGVLHSIDDPQPPYKVEDDSYYFKKQGDYAKIIINARHTGLSIKTLTYLLSNLGANWFEFYDKQFSLPIINKVWRTSINQYNMHILLNGEDVGNIRGKSDIINETGEDFLIYAKVSDDHDYINITLDYIEDWYVINNVTVDFSEDVPYSIKEIETDFLPFNISTNEERIINIKNNSYDNYLFSIKGWYKPYWALKQNQSFEQSTKHLLTEVLPATTLFGSWNYVEKNLESINDIVKE